MHLGIFKLRSTRQTQIFASTHARGPCLSPNGHATVNLVQNMVQVQQESMIAVALIINHTGFLLFFSLFSFVLFVKFRLSKCWDRNPSDDVTCSSIAADMRRDYPGQCLIENYSAQRTFLTMKDSGFTISSPKV